MDTWLVRLSNLSQVGLFGLTLGALYFTVIPLYKTAALEEAIAKRESELRDAETRLAKTQKQLADVTELAYTRDRSELLRNYVFYAGAQCSGLLRKAETPLKLGETRPETPLLDIDVRKCLLDELHKSKQANKLRLADRQALVAAVDAVGAKLEALRAEALKEIAEVPQRAARDRSTWAPKGEYERRAEELETRIRSVAPNLRDWDKIALESAIRRTRFAVANRFEEAVRKEVQSLRTSIAWPAAQPSSPSPAR